MTIEIKHKITGEILLAVDAADLSGANLRGANLSGANLRGANLREIDPAIVVAAITR